MEVWINEPCKTSKSISTHSNRSLEFRASELQTDLQSDFEVLDNPVKDVFVDTVDVLSLLL